MHKIFILLSLIMLVSCHKREASISPEEQARRDSLALHVAVIPVADCLPIYYAQQMGIFDSLGVDVRVEEYLSQMDCDTAITQGHVQLSYTDLPRLILMNDTAQLCAIMQCPGSMQLIGARSKRIRNLKQMKERMVALDRHSTADYWSDEIMSYAGMEQADIYRPQVNDIQLRTSMLCDQLIDAALLPQPYAEEAIERGHKPLFETPDSGVCLNCFIMPRALQKDTLREHQISLFIKGYNEAVRQITKAKPTTQDSIHALLFHHFGMRKMLADTLHLPAMRELFAPQPSNVDVAASFLRKRGKLPRQFKADSLLYTQFLKP